MSTCLNRYAVSPEIVERLSRDEVAEQQVVERLLDVVAARVARSRRPRRLRPITAARCRTAFDSAGSRSMRAAISAWTVSGMRRRPVLAALASMRMVSSRKSGLPSVFSSSTCRVSGETARSGAQRVDQLLAVVAAERLELDRGRANAAAAPARPDVEQLGPREADDQERRVAHPLGDVLDQLEQRLLGPVDVLEDEHERLRVGQLSRPLAGGPGDLLLAALALDGLEHAGGEAEQVGDRLVRAALAELLDRDLERVVVGDARRVLDHLGERPVRDALAVGQRAPGEDRRALERLEELARGGSCRRPARRRS